MQWIKEKKIIKPHILGNWKIIPESGGKKEKKKITKYFSAKHFRTRNKIILKNINDKPLIIIIMNTDKSKKLFEEAKKYIPGGVNSPVRAFKSVGGDPLFIQRGEGFKILGCRWK